MSLIERMINLGIFERMDDKNVAFTESFMNETSDLLIPMVEERGEDVFYEGAKSHNEASFNLLIVCAEKVALEKMGGVVRDEELEEIREAIKRGFEYRMKVLGMDF